MIRVFSVHTFSFRYTLVFVGAEGMMVWSFGVLFVLVKKVCLIYLHGLIIGNQDLNDVG